MKYEEVVEYLKEYSTKEPPYDPVGAIHLFKAAMENLQQHFIENDFEEYAACLDKKNEAFLKKLLAFIPISRKISSIQDEEFEK